jgi:AraC-like DNA-binding protein
MSAPVLPSVIPTDLVAPPVPVAHARLLLHLTEQRGVPTAQLMRAAGVPPEALERGDGHLFASEYAALIAQALILSQDPCLGCEFGLNIPPTMLGFLGYALLSASTLGEALELGVKYARLGSRFVDVCVSHTPDGVELTMSTLMPLGFAQQFAIESTLLAWFNTAQHLVGPGTTPSRAQLRFAWPRPEAFERYRPRLPDTRFDCAAHQIFVPLEDLARPLALAHPVASRQALAQCDTALAELMSSEQTFISKVAQSLSLSSEGYPGMAEVAERLRISTRTLMRRLDRLGVSFRQLLDERRRLESQRLLSASVEPIESIATRLGYNNPANFTRAFRRWTGETPSQYRQRST